VTDGKEATSSDCTPNSDVSFVGPRHETIKDVAVVSILRVEGGKIVERWSLTNLFELQKQLALFPGTEMSLPQS